MGLLGFLFGHKRRSFTPVLDDWPPEGSMHFVCREPHPSEHLPANFLHYEFGPNWNESDPVAIDLGLKILRSLCQDKLVLTDVRSTDSYYYSRHPKKMIETFPEYYIRFLQETQPDIAVYLEGNRNLAYLTTGYDEGLRQSANEYFSMYRIGIDFFDDHYVLPQECRGMDAQAALASVKVFQYDMKLEYIKYGPTSLEININTDTVDIASVRAVVDRICRENQVLLLNPPG